jgi:hypothetical protein
VATAATFDSDGAGSAPAESYVKSSTAAITPGLYPYFLSGQDQLVTHVTWYVISGTENAKRVTVVWTGRDGRTVVESTIIADAERGIPNPEFSVAPQVASLVQPMSAADQQNCFSHTITNDGSRDRYEFVFPALGNYTGSVYSDGGTIGVRDAGDVVLVDQNVNGHPDTASSLSRGQSAKVLVCYQRSADAAEQVTFTTRVRSTVDNTYGRDLAHTLKFTPTLVLYLQHLDDGIPPAKGGSEALSLSPPPSLTEQPSLPNYDSTDSYEGKYVQRRKNSELDWDVAFNYVMPSAWTLTTSASLRIWTRSTESFPQSGDDDLNLRYQLQRVNAAGTVLSTYTYDAPKYKHLKLTGWYERTHALTLPAAWSFAAGDNLRLVVHCREEDHGKDCHVAYDHETYPSALTVTLQ